MEICDQFECMFSEQCHFHVVHWTVAEINVCLHLYIHEFSFTITLVYGIIIRDIYMYLSLSVKGQRCVQSL